MKMDVDFCAQIPLSGVLRLGREWPLLLGLQSDEALPQKQTVSLLLRPIQRAEDPPVYDFREQSLSKTGLL